jgi:hypothetical protein
MLLLIKLIGPPPTGQGQESFIVMLVVGTSLVPTIFSFIVFTIYSIQFKYKSKYTMVKEMAGSLEDIEIFKRKFGLKTGISPAKTLLILNPITLLIVGPILLIIFNLKLIKRSCKVVLNYMGKSYLWPFEMLGRFILFICRVFKYIHSDRRLLCFCEGALGTLAGMYWGNPIIGFIAGVLFGLISYQVISIRILKLKPKH